MEEVKEGPALSSSPLPGPALEVLSGGDRRDKHEAASAVSDSGKGKAEATEKQQVCSFFVRTASCAYGSRCRFLHPQNIPPPTLNSRGLPLRPAEPSCAHYLKKGWCAFGMTCKFNHPELLTHAPTSPLTIMGQPGPQVLVTSAQPGNTVLRAMPAQPGQQVLYTTAPAQPGLTAANVMQGPAGGSVQPGTVLYLPTASGGYHHVQQPTYLHPSLSEGTGGGQLAVVGNAGDAGIQALYTQQGSQLQPVYTTGPGGGGQLGPTAVYATQVGPGGQLQFQQGLTGELIQPVVTVRGSGSQGQLPQHRQPLGSDVIHQQHSRGGLHLGGLVAQPDVGGPTVTYLSELDSIEGGAGGSQQLQQIPTSYIQQLPALQQLHGPGGYMQQQWGSTPLMLGAEQALDAQQAGAMGHGLELRSAGGAGLPPSLLAAHHHRPGSGNLTGGAVGAAAGAGAHRPGGLPMGAHAHASQERLVHAMQSLRLQQQQQQQQQQN